MFDNDYNICDSQYLNHIGDSIGAILIAVVPEYTERIMGVVLDDPVGSFVYGILSLIGLSIVILLLVITVIGIFAAFPLIVVAYVVWAIGAAIAYLAIADRLVGHEDGWLKPLLVGAGINGLLMVTGIGVLLAICIGAAGFGAVLKAYFS
jgi:hypothetical protein